MSDIDKEFVEFVVKALVDDPDQVVIERSVDERGVLLELTVAPDDMGKVIGKAGSTAKAIRTLLRVLGAKSDARFNLKIVEPEGSAHQSDKAESDDHDKQEATDSEATNEQAHQEVDESTDRADDIKAKAREGLEDLDLDV
jgi:predicted RNA-binding protein YlqC (UPF0109 family)